MRKLLFLVLIALPAFAQNRSVIAVSTLLDGRGGVVKNTQKMYMSCAHTDADVAKTLDAFEDALKRF